MEIHPSSELLCAALDRELPPEELSQIELHVMACSSCQRVFGAQENLKELLKGVSDKIMPVSLVEALEERTGESPAQSRSGMFRPWLQWIPAAGFALASCLILIGTWHRLSPSKEEIPLESLLAAHHRYQQESVLPSADLSSELFSTKLSTSTY